MQSATEISTSPLFKVKFGNLIQDPSAGNGGSVEDSGLVCAIEGFTYAPNMEMGFVDDVGDAYGNLYPKEVKLAAELKILHTHGLGWQGTKKRSPNFPYGGTGGGVSIGTSGTDSTPEEVQAANESRVLE